MYFVDRRVEQRVIAMPMDNVFVMFRIDRENNAETHIAYGGGVPTSNA